MTTSKRTVKGWAVLDNKGDITTVATSVFKDNIAHPFATFKRTKEDEAVWNKRIMKEYRLKVIPCTITYTLTKKPNKKV